MRNSITAVSKATGKTVALTPPATTAMPEVSALLVKTPLRKFPRISFRMGEKT